MTIYDLEKQATPGPLEVVCCTGGDGVRLREGLLCFDRDSPDAKLLIHCRNHFMEALEALKTAEDTISNLQDNEGHPSTLWLRTLIAKLEDVK